MSENTCFFEISPDSPTYGIVLDSSKISISEKRPPLCEKKIPQIRTKVDTKQNYFCNRTNGTCPRAEKIINTGAVNVSREETIVAHAIRESLSNTTPGV